MRGWQGGLLALALGLLASCNAILDNDEGVLDPSLANGGTVGNLPSGGRPSSSGGSISTGNTGNVGTGNTGNVGIGNTGNTPGASATKLGAPCTTKADCTDAEAPGLICLTATQKQLAGGAPPKGMCTAPCDPAEEDACGAYGPGALCWTPLSSAATDSAFCVEACSFGAPEEGEAKCHDREEFACNPWLSGSASGLDCTEDLDCDLGESCLSGTCQIVLPACTPACRGDIDCAGGMYCDQSLLKGTCVSTRPTGKALGEPCTVEAEPDECIGFCQPDVSGSTLGHCAANCSLGTNCNYDATTQLYGGICFAFSSVEEARSTGDFGFCSRACDCSSECYQGNTCQLPANLELSSITYSAPGLCLSPTLGFNEPDTCSP